MTASLAEILRTARVVPVAVFEDLNAALETAAVLVRGSLPVIEITLRTKAALDCIRAVSDKFPDLQTGAGSVLSVEALDDAHKAGARFAVAPCLDPDVVRHAREIGIPFVPGVATPSELNCALKLGCEIIKIFPAEDLGGPAYINALTAPFKLKEFSLIPTGGINEKNIGGYFSIPRVIACGASYVVDSRLVEKGDFASLADRVRSISSGLRALG
ncbi:MAG: bifunctional 4-hydroxy-2-oxoglutarate aldolase/2-dehydro-3-deoxy-phosphogluconate aldolase [Spirochaetes bacterium]|nr:MAG: bifunctional 4-hydroxy-2-oxoglutarate aldolase/2-dehydro-3-deoxy-phosphogluconate aldolase [Spirochaetota bacterium]